MARQRHIFSDPNSGIGYATGAKWPSDHASAVLAGLRALEKSIYRSIAQNWKASTSSTLGGTAGGMVYDESVGRWVIKSSTAGTVAGSWTMDGLNWDASPTIPSTPDGFNVITATGSFAHIPASSGAGKYVYGGGPTSSSTDKILESTDGDSWNLRSLNTANTNEVSLVVWDPNSSLFVAATTGGAAAELETSPDGITWTSRTIPGSVGTKDGARGLSNEETGAGALIAIWYGATSDVYITSPDGVNWTGRTMPASATLYRAAYSKGQSKWMAAGGNIYVSDDCISWTAVNTPTSYGSVTSLVSVGDIFVIAHNGGGGRIAFSEDNGQTWLDCFQGDVVELHQSDRQLVAVGSTTAIHFSHVA